MLARGRSSHAWRRAAPAAALILAAIILAGTAVRLEPVRRAGGVEFDFDAAFHFREVRAASETGRVPAVDPLGLAPGGKPVAALLPTLLYHLVAAWHRLLGWLGLASDLKTRPSYSSPCRRLVAVPLYLAARARSARPALLAAAFAAARPAHVHRTAGHWLRTTRSARSSRSPTWGRRRSPPAAGAGSPPERGGRARAGGGDRGLARSLSSSPSSRSPSSPSS
jgi:hypothetical protein